MLKQGSFIRKKYYSLLFFNILTWSANAVSIMLDAILGGSQLGETALMAVSIVSPLYALISFFSYIFTPGCGILYGINIGEFKKESAYKIAGGSALTSIIIGILVSLLLLIIKGPYLNYYGCTGTLLEYASKYYNWYIILALLYPLMNTVYYLVLAEGGAFYMMIGAVELIVGNAILSIVLCKTKGINGLGMATDLSIFIGFILMSLHFFSKKSSVHFIFKLEKESLKRAFVLSANTALNYIFIAVVDIVMNKVILIACGQEYIAAYSVINLMLTLFMISGGAFDSCQGICTSFIGEKNNYGVKSILRTAMKTVCILGVVLMIGLFLSAPYIPKVYGLTSSSIIAASIRATRILSLSAIPFGITYFAYNLYTCLNKPGLSIVMAFLYNLFCPLLLSIPFAFIFGFDGVSVGMSISSFLVIALFVWFIRAKYGKEDFPLYLEDTGEEVVAFDLKVTEETIVEIRDKVKEQLHDHGYEIENIELLVEELYTRIFQKNPKKLVCSECALLFGPGHVRIIVRDDGTIFNFVDENNVVESLNAHVLNSLLEQTEHKNYLVTTSFNRNGFVFEKA